MDELDDWIGGIDPLIGHLQAFQLPEDFPLDFSLRSLERLEALVLARYDKRQDMAHADEKGFVEGVMAYLGEVLLRLGGGSWGWQEDPERRLPGQPVVLPDERLRVPPVSPIALLIEAVEARNGAFAQTYAALQEQVDLRRTENPAWSPVKHATHGVDRIDPGPSDFLQRWLAERERTFPEWAARYGDARTYDFSPASLEPLEQLARRLVPTEEQLYDPVNVDFVEGAAWYIGEVMRAAKGGDWFYRPPEPKSRSPYAGRPYIRQPTEDGGATAPILDLHMIMQGKRPPGYLRERYADFAR